MSPHCSLSSNAKERPTKPQRAKAWTALDQYTEGSLHVSAGI